MLRWQRHDVDYQDFFADPVATVRGIYQTFDLGWTTEAEASVTAIDEESRRGGKRPSHRYSLDDYGLTEADVRSAFSD